MIECCSIHWDCTPPASSRLAPIGETFDALVTGASDKGTSVRLLKPPAEGKLVAGYETVDVGDQIKVRLTALNVERGFIDFARSGGERKP